MPTATANARLRDAVSKAVFMTGPCMECHGALIASCVSYCDSCTSHRQLEMVAQTRREEREESAHQRELAVHNAHVQLLHREKELRESEQQIVLLNSNLTNEKNVITKLGQNLAIREKEKDRLTSALRASEQEIAQLRDQLRTERSAHTSLRENFVLLENQKIGVTSALRDRDSALAANQAQVVELRAQLAAESTTAVEKAIDVSRQLAQQLDIRAQEYEAERMELLDRHQAERKEMLDQHQADRKQFSLERGELSEERKQLSLERMQLYNDWKAERLKTEEFLIVQQQLHHYKLQLDQQARILASFFDTAASKSQAIEPSVTAAAAAPMSPSQVQREMARETKAMAAATGPALANNH